MTRLLLPTLTLLVATLILSPARSQKPDEEEPRLPNGRSQIDAILKADHAKNLDDLNRISQLTEEVRAELEKNDRFVMSIESLKKMEEVEKLAKRVRNRMKRR